MTMIIMVIRYLDGTIDVLETQNTNYAVRQYKKMSAYNETINIE